MVLEFSLAGAWKEWFGERLGETIRYKMILGSAFMIRSFSTMHALWLVLSFVSWHEWRRWLKYSEDA